MSRCCVSVVTLLWSLVELGGSTLPRCLVQSHTMQLSSGEDGSIHARLQQFVLQQKHANNIDDSNIPLCTYTISYEVIATHMKTIVTESFAFHSNRVTKEEKCVAELTDDLKGSYECSYSNDANASNAQINDTAVEYMKTTGSSDWYVSEGKTPAEVDKDETIRTEAFFTNLESSQQTQTVRVSELSTLSPVDDVDAPSATVRYQTASATDRAHMAKGSVHIDKKTKDKQQKSRSPEPLKSKKPVKNKPKDKRNKGRHASPGHRNMVTAKDNLDRGSPTDMGTLSNLQLESALPY